MNNEKLFFLTKVKNQIKSKEAQEFVATELDYHLTESKKTWMKKGLNENQAEIKAVEQMGNPLKIGQKLNKLHRPKVDWLLVLLLIITMGLSFLPLSIEGFSFGSSIGINKIIIVLIGIIGVIVMMFINYRKLVKLGWFFYLLGGLILIFIQYLSNNIVFGHPVIEIGFITIESLMAIPFFFLAWSSFFNNKRFKIWHFTILLLLSLYLFFMATNITTVYIYLLMIFTMIWWSKFSKKIILSIYVISSLIVILTGIIVLPTIREYQITRLLAYFNPEEYGNFMIIQLKEMLQTAGWFGRTNSTEFLQGAYTDFAFVSLTFHYGWIFAIVLIIILLLFVIRIILMITKIKDSYGRLLLIGIISIYSVQVVSNIGMTFGWLPLMSISLPFISYGFMPTLLNAFLIGVALSVYRRKDLVFIETNCVKN